MMARRSELAARDQGDIIDHGDEGIGVFIAFSKTDRDARGIQVLVPFGQHEATCAVRALRTWIALLASRGLDGGALFRPIDRHGKIGGETGTAAKAATTYAAGAPVSGIATQGRWSPKSTALLSYTRAVDQWNDHPMKGLGL